MKKIFLLVLVFLSLFYQRSIAGLKTSASQITVSAFVGEHRFTLYGYTSPGALVSFEGLGVFDQTYADSKGYFELKNRFSPFSPREACLTAQDVLGRLSAPLCLPPFPTIYNVEIGPVIMPPTVSVDNGEYFVGDEAMLSGQTVPNTEVDLAFFTNTRQTTLNITRNNAKFSRSFAFSSASFRVIPLVEAYSIPELRTTSDKKGNFSISIPTSNPNTLRAFTRATYENSFSPKSLTLNIKVLPWWMIILKIFWLVLEMIKTRWLEIGLLAEFVIFLSILLNHFFHPHRLAKARAIVLRERFPLMKSA